MDEPFSVFTKQNDMGQGMRNIGNKGGCTSKSVAGKFKYDTVSPVSLALVRVYHRREQ